MYDNDDYAGEDLILLTGAPGSRWSSVHSILISCSDDFNKSEISPKPWRVKTIAYGTPLIANHRGVYWGPNNEFGEKFDYLHDCSKAYLLEEFNKPFKEPGKIKIIKSHWFSYNLKYLANVFPKAKIVLCYADEADCFYWWHKCGGWGIPYPDYTWYKNDSGMLKQIREENYHILRFCIENNLQLEFMKLPDLTDKLGINISKDFDYNLNCKIAVFTGPAVADFTHLRANTHQMK
jgi:hypothetical protein